VKIRVFEREGERKREIEGREREEYMRRGSELNVGYLCMTTVSRG